MSSVNQRFIANSPLFGVNSAFLENLYEGYLKDPESIPGAWRQRFDEWAEQENKTAQPDISRHKVQENFRRLAKEKRVAAQTAKQVLSPKGAEKQAAVLRLINAYRVRGFQNAHLDPINLNPPKPLDELTPEFHGLSSTDMETTFNTGTLYAADRMTLREILSLLQKTYGGTVGAEYMYITDTSEKRWIQKRLEGYKARPIMDDDSRRHLLSELTAAETLERYLHSKYVGQKRFSLEGGESLIPMLDELIQRSGSQGMKEVVMGMAHRGRLNVLTNILGKPPEITFGEFEGKPHQNSLMTAGDVKYHMGFSTDVETPGGIVNVVLGFNPSHLEIISPVVEGSVRARQHRLGDHQGSNVMPILIHGDAAFAGQGVVMETFNLSQARGFTTGGSVHIIINNQIGFTTSNPLDARSTTNCTDVAKMVEAPIFHVNADDPEAVIFVTRLALDFRMAFQKDVVIDLICYRRHGHNEADEPAVTQPRMYKTIRQHRTTRQLYADYLGKLGIADKQLSQQMIDEYRKALEEGRPVEPVVPEEKRVKTVDWKPYYGTRWSDSVDTGADIEHLRYLALRQLELPEAFELHPRVEKILANRRSMAMGDKLVDWGFAENLAYASLLEQGYAIRLSGQDSGRGTFFHRHAVLHNQENGESFVPLQNLTANQAHFCVIDSLLSEEAVLAYEYGYATAEPNSLTLWEAQFGDFANGAQVVIDQFITSGGAKWGLLCGLVMLLPHGFEGQGAEHSSARLERYLQLCAENNIQVCVPSTPAQVFHMLRRQMLRPYRRPLIVMTPKSLLRHKLATSTMDSLAQGAFEPVLDEVDDVDIKAITQVIVCSGKVYYELLETRRSRGLHYIAIIRLEQLYPFPHKDLRMVLQSYPNLETLIWCQEEPQNQGAWDQIKHKLYNNAGQHVRLHYVGRPTCAAPAVGNSKEHLRQQEQLIDDALTANINPIMNRRLIR